MSSARINPLVSTASGSMYPTKEHNGPAPPEAKLGSIAERRPANGRITQTRAEFKAALLSATKDPGYDPSPTERAAIINAIQAQYTARGEDAEFIELKKQEGKWFARICTAAACVMVPLLVAIGAMTLTRGGTRRRQRRHRRTRRLRSNRLKSAF
jgi:hypothetical protein